MRGGGDKGEDDVASNGGGGGNHWGSRGGGEIKKSLCVFGVLGVGGEKSYWGLGWKQVVWSGMKWGGGKEGGGSKKGVKGWGYRCREERQEKGVKGVRAEG